MMSGNRMMLLGNFLFFAIDLNLFIPFKELIKLLIFSRRPSGETTISLLSTSRTSFTNVRSCMSNPRISTASSRSQLSQPDVTGKPLLNPLVRRLSQNSAVYEPPLEGV